MQDTASVNKEGPKFGNCFRAGEMMSIVLLSATLSMQDQIMSCIQFKRFEHCVWVNYIGTTSSLAKNHLLGTTTFLGDNKLFRGMGMALCLLRCLQLYQCSHGALPNVFIQVKTSSALAAYLKNRGFIQVEDQSDLSSYIEFKDSVHLETNPGIMWRDNKNHIILCLKGVALANNLEEDGSKWKADMHNTIQHHHSVNSNNLSSWPENFTLFRFPFSVNGSFIDQCAKGLYFFGCPFFSSVIQRTLIMDYQVQQRLKVKYLQCQVLTTMSQKLIL